MARWPAASRWMASAALGGVTCAASRKWQSQRFATSASTAPSCRDFATEV